MNGAVRVSRCVAVWAGVTAGTVALLAWLATTTTRPGGSDVVGWLTTGCTAAAAGCVGWLWLLTTLLVSDALRGRPAPRAGVPGVVRRLVLAGCGLTLAGGGVVLVTAPAQASGPAADHAARPAVSETLLVGLPLPDRTTSTTAWLAQLGRHTATHRSPSAQPSVVVAPGDSLWAIAERSLHNNDDLDDLDDLAVERRWRAIYRANREVIGADPDLIVPGQRLVLPVPPRGKP
jgi:hypothetical protein